MPVTCRNRILLEIKQCILVVILYVDSGYTMKYILYNKCAGCTFKLEMYYIGFLMQNCQSWWLFLTLSSCSSRCENFYVKRNGNEVFQNLSHSCCTAPILFFFVQTYLLRWHNKYPIDFNNVFQQNDGLLSLV